MLASGDSPVVELLLYHTFELQLPLTAQDPQYPFRRGVRDSRVMRKEVYHVQQARTLLVVPIPGVELLVEGVNVVDRNADFGVNFMDGGKGVKGGGGESKAHGVAQSGSDESGCESRSAASPQKTFEGSPGYKAAWHIFKSGIMCQQKTERATYAQPASFSLCLSNEPISAQERRASSTCAVMHSRAF